MPKQSRRKAAKAKIKAAQEEAEAKAAFAEAERQRLEEERLQEERKRNQVIPFEKCALLNHRYVYSPSGKTKIETMESCALAMRADDAWCFVKEGKDLRDAISTVIGNTVETMKKDLYDEIERQGSFIDKDKEILDMVTETALFVLALSKPLDVLALSKSLEEHDLAYLDEVCNTIVSSATKGDAIDRLGMQQIAFLLKAAETSHLDALACYYSGGECWVMSAANAWALYNAVITSHPIIVDAYNAYRRSIVDGLVRLHNEGDSGEIEFCLPPTEEELVDCAMDNLLLSLQCIGICLPPLVAYHPEKSSWVVNDERFGHITLLDVYGPRPDGVTCTNEDPKTCAVCLTASINNDDRIHLDDINFCCGTIVCDDCSLRAHLPDFCGWICGFCGQVSSDSGRYLMMERHVERGRPWAQFALGLTELGLYLEEGVGDNAKAILLLEEAASQGNPDAMIVLSEVLYAGMVVPIDRRRAVGFALHAPEIEPVRLFERACTVATCAVHELSIASADPSRLNECIGVLSIFVKGGGGSAHRAHASMCFDANREDIAFQYYECGLICDIARGRPDEGILDPAHNVMKKYIAEERIPKLQFFYSELSKINATGCIVGDETETLDETLTLARNALIKARRSCAHCGTSLDARNRRMCKNCRGACYCSRKCQKKHWNRVDYKSHKHDCELVSMVRLFAVAAKEAIDDRKNLDVRGTIDYLKDLNFIP